ncbi:hypothetical protein M758_3G201500, partial [Ceratodon purpureus]
MSHEATQNMLPIEHNSRSEPKITNVQAFNSSQVKPVLLFNRFTCFQVSFLSKPGRVILRKIPVQKHLILSCSYIIYLETMLDISRYGSWSTVRFKLHDIAEYAECPTNNKRITAQEFSPQSICLAKRSSWRAVQPSYKALEAGHRAQTTRNNTTTPTSK